MIDPMISGVQAQALRDGKLAVGLNAGAALAHYRLAQAQARLERWEDALHSVRSATALLTTPPPPPPKPPPPPADPSEKPLEKPLENPLGGGATVAVQRFRQLLAEEEEEEEEEAARGQGADTQGQPQQPHVLPTTAAKAAAEQVKRCPVAPPPPLPPSAAKYGCGGR
jgi:hypothetical protein